MKIIGNCVLNEFITFKREKMSNAYAAKLVKPME